MGCFDGTCLISNLPVRQFDEVVCIEYRYETGITIYELLTGKVSLQRAAIAGVEELAEVLPYTTEYLEYMMREGPEIRAIYGHYNDYGYVTEIERRDGYGYLVVRMDVLEAFTINVFHFKEGAELFLDDLAWILRLAFSLRRGLPLVTGHQWSDKEELHLHRLLAEAVLKITEKALEE